MQVRHRYEQANKACQECHQYAGHQHAAHETEVFAGGERVSRQSQEDGAGTSEGGHYQLGSVGKVGDIDVEDGSQGNAHESGECEYAENAPGAAGEPVGEEQQAEIPDQRDDGSGMWQIELHRQGRRARAE